MQKNARFLAAPLAIAIGLAAPGTLAQSGAGVIEEVTVTAQKREENLQQTPIAITALSGDTLGKLGVTDFTGIAKQTPSIGFTAYPSSSTTLIMYMRGQGVSDPMQITSDGSIGLYQDGFYISRPQAATFDLADVERVEVLRGPQGTLYGRNTTGGAINLISKKPSGEFGFKQNLSFGSRDYFRSLTTVDLPKIGDVSTKISLLKSDKDGYVKNSGNGNDFGEEGQQAGRFSLNWAASDTVSVDYFLEKGEIDSTPIYYQNEGLRPRDKNPRSRTYRDFDLNDSNADFEGHGLTLTWDVSENLTVKSLTGYRELNFDAWQDYADVFTVAPGLAIGFITHDVIESEQFTQEFQFIGKLGERIDYVAGLYYFKESGSHLQDLDVSLLFMGPDNYTNSSRLVKSDAKSKAIYAQATWTPAILDDRLDLTFGGRFTKDSREATRSIVANGVFSGFPVPLPGEQGGGNDKDFSKFNPAFTANFNVNDDLSVYGKVTTGYKAGGSSESGPLGSFDLTFGPEEVTTFELGMKSYWWDRRVRLNAAVFRSDFDDMQLGIVVDPADNSIVQSLNAGSATVDGLELELTVMPVDDLTLSLNYAYLDPTFEEVEVIAGTVYDPATNPSSPYQVGQNIKDVFVLPYAPENSIGVSMDYTMYRFERGDVSLFLNYRWQDDQFLTANVGKAVPNRELYQQDAYGLLDARLTVSMELPRGDTAKVSLWGKNVLDKEYQAHVIGAGASVATGPVPAGLYGQAVAFAEPASFGIDLVYEY